MTIGTNMPFKLKLPIPVRAAKEESQGDFKEMPGGKELQLNFGSLLEAVSPHRKSASNHIPDDEKHAEREISPNSKDEDSASLAQGAFTQPIIALEQMLDRRRGDQTGFVPDALTDQPDLHEAVSVAPSGAAELIPEDSDAPKQVDAGNAPAGKEQQPGQTSKRAISLSGSHASPVPEQTLFEPPLPAPVSTSQQEIEVASSTLASTAVKLEKHDFNPVGETLQDVVAAPDKDTFQQTVLSLPQATAKPFVGTVAMVVVPANSPAVTGIEVVSDRTTGAARTLVIQLQPVELGTVTARLRLTSDGMHIQIAAASTAMAEHLSNDREALGKALHRAGVTEDASNVTISIVDRSHAGAGNPQPGQQNLDGQDPQQLGARANNQGQSGFQNMPEDRPARPNLIAEVADDHVELPAKPAAQIRSSRGLVV
jgi:chemotaxis protein MotD